jgi:hypothetical protein
VGRIVHLHRPDTAGSPPTYAAAVDWYLTGAGISAGSVRVYRIVLDLRTFQLYLSRSTRWSAAPSTGSAPGCQRHPRVPLASPRRGRPLPDSQRAFA